MFYCNNFLLKEIATIQPGYSLRSKVPETPKGSMAIIQMKDVSPEEISWDRLRRMNPTGKKEPRFLQERDIIFSGRGTRIFATPVTIHPEKTVAGPQFFVITLEKPRQAQYISWYINSYHGQHYFWTNAGGSSLLNVRKEVLENLPLPMPADNHLSTVTEYITAMETEKKHFTELQHKRQRLLEGIIAKSMEA
jgi:hypothetical protein